MCLAASARCLTARSSPSDRSFIILTYSNGSRRPRWIAGVFILCFYSDILSDLSRIVSQVLQVSWIFAFFAASPDKEAGGWCPS